MQRRTILFSGHVQGVGFRFTVRQIAAGYPVNGFVRNLPDGRVELVAEGDPPNIDAFLHQITDRMSGYVECRDETISGWTGEFRQFEIRR
jgi:acylphosphatase